MRLPKIITITLLACVSHTALTADITESEKSEFVSWYKETIKLAEEFPEQQSVYAIFHDLDADGSSEAIATSKSGYYEDGYIWNVYTQSEGGWSPVPSRNLDSGRESEYGSIFARLGELFEVITNNGAKEYLVLQRVYDNQVAGGIGPLRIAKFKMVEGQLIEDTVPNLQHYVAYGGPRKADLISAMHALPIEHFKGQ